MKCLIVSDSFHCCYSWEPAILREIKEGKDEKLEWNIVKLQPTLPNGLP